MHGEINALSFILIKFGSSGLNPEILVIYNLIIIKNSYLLINMMITT